MRSLLAGAPGTAWSTPPFVTWICTIATFIVPEKSPMDGTAQVGAPDLLQDRQQVGPPYLSGEARRLTVLLIAPLCPDVKIKLFPLVGLY